MLPTLTFFIRRALYKSLEKYSNLSIFRIKYLEFFFSFDLIVFGAINCMNDSKVDLIGN